MRIAGERARDRTTKVKAGKEEARAGAIEAKVGLTKAETGAAKAKARSGGLGKSRNNGKNVIKEITTIEKKSRKTNRKNGMRKCPEEMAMKSSDVAARGKEQEAALMFPHCPEYRHAGRDHRKKRA